MMRNKVRPFVMVGIDSGLQFLLSRLEDQDEAEKKLARKRKWFPIDVREYLR